METIFGVIAFIVSCIGLLIVATAIPVGCYYGCVLVDILWEKFMSWVRSFIPEPPPTKEELQVTYRRLQGYQD